MSPKRYLAICLVLVMLLGTITVGLNLIIDPYGLSPLKMTLAGINQPKVARVNNDRLIKPYDILRYQPRTIFLGTSRVKQGFDPEVLDNTIYEPVYNGGLDGGDLGEILTLLEHSIRVNPNLKYVFVELFFQVFAKGEGQPIPPPPPEINWQQYLHDWTSMLFSSSALVSSLETIVRNRTGILIDFYSFAQPNGFSGPPKTFRPDYSFKLFPQRVYTKIKSWFGMKVHPGYYQYMDAIVDLCRQHDINLSFFISPYHSYTLYPYWSIGGWDVWENWKRRLASYGNVYDFSRYNSITDEKVAEEMNYWYEQYHFNPSLGEVIINILSGKYSPQIPDNFGKLLRPETVENDIQQWRDERDTWIAHNPEYVEAFALESKKKNSI